MSTATNSTITISLDNMTIDEGLSHVESITSKFKEVNPHKVRFTSSTLSEINKLRAASVTDYGRLQLLQGMEKDKEAEIQQKLLVQAAIIDVYDYLISLHNTTTTNEEEASNV